MARREIGRHAESRFREFAIDDERRPALRLISRKPHRTGLFRRCHGRIGTRPLVVFKPEEIGVTRFLRNQAEPGSSWRVAPSIHPHTTSQGARNGGEPFAISASCRSRVDRTREKRRIGPRLEPAKRRAGAQGGNVDPRCGFEPQFTDSESVVLPLDDRGSRRGPVLYPTGRLGSRSEGSDCVLAGESATRDPK